MRRRSVILGLLAVAATGSVRALLDELVALADEKSADQWKAFAILIQGMAVCSERKGCGRSSNDHLGDHCMAVSPSNGLYPVVLVPFNDSHAQLGQFDDAWRCIATLVRTTKETWCEAEVHRTAGEIALKSPAPDTEKAEKYFDRALEVARKQKAKSWQLRAAMSMARLWRDQGKRDDARELLAPVFGWFTEDFDTLDLKEAKALLEELVA
jgi:hypothetical protein